MPLPTINLTISANAVAAYAAIVSTITGTIQFLNYLRDRSRIEIRVQPNMTLIVPGNAVYHNNKLFTVVYVSNEGRRPITITSVGAHYLDKNRAFVFTDTHPQTPCELTEGKQMTAMFPQDEIDISAIEKYEVGFATGKPHFLSVVPWYRRRWSHHLRMREIRKERKASLKTL
jgi:hypothetical protein